MEKLTVKMMVEQAEAVAIMTDNAMILNGFYVYTDRKVYNDLTVLEAITTYIDNRNSSGYIAIGINYNLVGSGFPLALDIVNNKLGFVYVCQDYTRIECEPVVREAMKQIAEAILVAYGNALRVHSQEEYRILMSKQMAYNFQNAH